jgi:hypothetical protein
MTRHNISRPVIFQKIFIIRKEPNEIAQQTPKNKLRKRPSLGVQFFSPRTNSILSPSPHLPPKSIASVQFFILSAPYFLDCSLLGPKPIPLILHAPALVTAP